VSCIRSIIRGCGSYLPERVVTNDELSSLVETSNDWIVERTGIRERRIAGEGETTSDMAIFAAERALSAADLAARDIDLVVLATATPDLTFPATATMVQSRLGMTGGFAFDVHAVCSGFVYALATADNFIKAGQAGRALVIGSETLSRILDWQDRGTCVLFGDGAGAVVVEAGEGAGSPQDRGVLTSHLHSDGRLKELLYVDGGPATTGTAGYLRMRGREVFRHAVVKLSDVIEEALTAVKLTPADLDWIVPHQANARILDGTARKMNFPLERVVNTVAKHANTSAASIPLALDTAIGDGRIKQGQLVLLEALGGGLTWGASLVRW